MSEAAHEAEDKFLGADFKSKGVIIALSFGGVLVCICWCAVIAVKSQNMLRLRAMKNAPVKVIAKKDIQLRFVKPKRKTWKQRVHPSIDNPVMQKPPGQGAAEWIKQWEGTRRQLSQNWVLPEPQVKEDMPTNPRKKRKRNQNVTARQLEERYRVKVLRKTEAKATYDGFFESEGGRDSGVVHGELQRSINEQCRHQSMAALGMGAVRAVRNFE